MLGAGLFPTWRGQGGSRRGRGRPEIPAGFGLPAGVTIWALYMDSIHSMACDICAIWAAKRRNLR